jgi:hypothetical protein
MPSFRQPLPPAWPRSLFRLRLSRPRTSRPPRRLRTASFPDIARLTRCAGWKDPAAPLNKYALVPVCGTVRLLEQGNAEQAINWYLTALGVATQLVQ